MAKILVADDNSNIQKMVGLALKDQGIDVVAVGNGEAAVRKISDVHPDLVLADVFMPVRNGYEVCQYVKGDTALAHIPVILLVGAFDPLDEQEAQRVGADGVLKKPFVPPDPLISMVKSALARAGVPIGGAAAPAPQKEAPLQAAEMIAPRTPPPPTAISLPALPDFPSADTEPVNDGMPARPEPVRIDAGSQPLAFGNLLESPAAESEDDLAFGATTARPELERDWKSEKDEEEEVEEEEEEKSSSWRRDAGDEALETEEESTGPVKDWRETAFSDAPTGRKSRSESWTPQKEISTLEEAAESEQSVAAMVTEAPVAETFAPVLPPPIPVTQTPAAPFSTDAWSAALTQKPSVEAATMIASEPLPHSSDAAPAAVHVEEPVSTPANASLDSAPAPEPYKPAPSANSWFSAVSSPWDADAQKATRLASTWDAPSTPTPPADSIPEPEQVAEPEPPSVLHQYPAATVDSLVEEAALPAATVEAIREETQQITETAIEQAPLATPSVEPAKATQPSMEELVAKVLAQMSPEVLQAVTREILKPVVEAMVRDEINGKKS